MKIVIVSCVFSPEPVVTAKISYELADCLANDNEVSVLCPFPSRPVGFDYSDYSEKPKNFKVIRINSFTYPKFSLLKRLWENISFGIKSTNEIKKTFSHYDIIYANTWPLFAQVLVVRQAKKLNIPIVVHIQDIYPESLINKFPTFLRKAIFMILFPLEKYITRNSAKVITISQRMSDIYRDTRNVNINKLEIVHNWQDELAFQKIFDVEQNETDNFKFMYLGNIGETCALDMILFAFKKAELKNAELIIAGGGSKKRFLENLTSELKVNNVRFISVQSGEEVRLQKIADILILPLKSNASLSSIPSKLPGYMFSRKPILALLDEGSDTAKAIIESGCGWVGSPTDVDWITQTLIKAASLKKVELKSMGEKGYDFALNNYSKKENLAKLSKIILGTCTK